ncbi:MAG: DNA mismatch repair protein MutS [Tannerella sp.]|jgi:DNA mismatch repair protein MutS|nr:DNA mismatch repair protein MutS [Tannerella sp.]
MRQYYEIKGKHPDAVLLFRVGDFYEMYGEDAVTGAGILGIVQTRRSNGVSPDVEMAGFPHHALDTYLPKLVRAGKRVAICDQLEDPKLAKKLVKRGVTELVTPGVSINDNILVHKENNFLAAIHFSRSACGVAFLDISTGEFMVSEGPKGNVDKLLSNFMPKEVLVKRGLRNRFDETFGYRTSIFEMEDWAFAAETARERLLKHFATSSLKGFGVDDLTTGAIAAGVILTYLDLTHHSQISHITTLTRIEEERFVRLDKFTIRNLELVHLINENGKTLFDVLDKTSSPMGARLLKRWILFPLTDIPSVRKRQEVVTCFLRHTELKQQLDELVGETGDLERLISKVSVGRISPREVVQLKVALQAIEPIRALCLESDEPELRRIGEKLDPCAALRDRIGKYIESDPPALIHKGGVIARGVHPELDSLRDLAFSGKDHLMQIQKRESERTGIPSLRISYNSVFGYYIEVRNAHKDKVPSDWIRKQTLTQAERYITEELKLYEEKILTAEDTILALEAQIFNELIAGMAEYVQPVQQNAQQVAQLDCLLSFAKAALMNRYTCPVLDDSDVIDIKAGRHPVIECQLPPEAPYIANDIYLDRYKQQILVITGPNMSGKSALLRQTALIALMAQTGSFVPAEHARIGLVDKIFTRVGASDNISAGESTFMVEMNEAASILNSISPRSLILFDELGRGTSTYDGISIAWAIIEYIHEHTTASARTLFATHYHELNEMARSFKRIRNFNVSVKEAGNKVILLRKLEPGGSEHSFGIHVAKMAGMPKSIVKRAGEILKQLESDNRQAGIKSKPVRQIAAGGEGYQLNFFQLDDPVLSRIRDEIIHIDVNNLTPLEALNKLNEIRRITGG